MYHLLFLPLIILLLNACTPISSITAVGTVASVQADRRSAGTILDDNTLELFLKNWAYNNPSIVGDSNIAFTVYDKKVLITGQVPNAEIKQNIADAILAERNDIRHVFNELSVGQNLSLVKRLQDERIEVQIKILFYDQSVFDPRHVELEVEDSVVYLMGAVTKREADKIVRQASLAHSVSKVTTLFDYLAQKPKAELEREQKEREQAERRSQADIELQELKKERTRIQNRIYELERIKRGEK